MWVLRTEQLKTSYVLDIFGEKKVVQAVREVDVDVRENEVYGIAGESGSGKTTLLKSLFGNIEPPLRHVGGKVWYRVDGKEVDLFSLTPEENNECLCARMCPAASCAHQIASNEGSPASSPPLMKSRYR